jgi:hypothetical protein
MRSGDIRANREKKGLGSIARRHLRNCRTAKGMATNFFFDTHHLPPTFSVLNESGPNFQSSEHFSYARSFVVDLLTWPRPIRDLLWDIDLSC